MWVYEQDTGRLHKPDGGVIATGYSGGNCGSNPEAINNHAMQDRHNIGPIVCGRFTFGTPINGSHLGPLAIPLIPDPSNQMFGRSGFFCHGDTNPPGKASKGCIIMTQVVREAISASDDKDLVVRLSIEAE